MPKMSSEVFVAFRSIGVEEAQAQAAAEALNRSDEIVDTLKTDMLALKWMVGTNVALTLILLGKLLLLP
jgi:hypothetical protein